MGPEPAHRCHRRTQELKAFAEDAAKMRGKVGCARAHAGCRPRPTQRPCPIDMPPLGSAACSRPPPYTRRQCYKLQLVTHKAPGSGLAPRS